MNCFEWTMKKFRDSFTLVAAVTDNLLICLTKPWSHPWIAGHYVHTTINQAFSDIWGVGGILGTWFWVKFKKRHNNQLLIE